MTDCIILGVYTFFVFLAGLFCGYIVDKKKKK